MALTEEEKKKLIEVDANNQWKTSRSFDAVAIYKSYETLERVEGTSAKAVRDSDWLWRPEEFLELKPGEYPIPMGSRYFYDRPSITQVEANPADYHSNNAKNNECDRKISGFASSLIYPKLTEYDLSKLSNDVRSSLKRLEARISEDKKKFLTAALESFKKAYPDPVIKEREDKSKKKGRSQKSKKDTNSQADTLGPYTERMATPVPRDGGLK